MQSASIVFVVAFVSFFLSCGGHYDSKRVKLSFVVDETKGRADIIAPGHGYNARCSRWAYLGFPPSSPSFATTKPFLPSSSSFSPSSSSPFSSRKRSHGGKVIVVIMPRSLVPSHSRSLQLFRFSSSLSLRSHRCSCPSRVPKNHTAPINPTNDPA